MLEGNSCLISRSLPSSCEPEAEWAYLAHDVLNGKRPAPEDAEEHPGCCIWELWSYDIEKDEMELTLTSFLPEGYTKAYSDISLRKEI